MSRCCLMDGILLREPEDVLEFEREIIYHLTAGGVLTRVSEPPERTDGEGCLALRGQRCVEPLEVAVEFLKAVDAESWLEALVLRHVERVRSVDPSVCALSEIKEAGA